MKKDFEIVLIGLGYVGLELAVAFGKFRQTLGVDTNENRVLDLKKFIDRNGEIEQSEIKAAKNLRFTSKIESNLRSKRIYIITVPTPIDNFKKPDLSYLKQASENVGAFLRKDDIVIYESTTYPTCTRDFCIPILEKTSQLSIDNDFGVGFCPERVDPGQNKKALWEMVRVISASNLFALSIIASVYQSIGQKTHHVSSLEVAEMSKLAENCQRDLNISFVNELALICDKLGIATKEVLHAAGTKWNFHNYQPGLVGGHCISVDPYYLIHKAEGLGYFPKLIGAGREVNEAMPAFIAAKCVKLLIKKNISVKGAKAIVLGLTFKENCSDFRNSKVEALIDELAEYEIKVDSFDPYHEKKSQFSSLKAYDLIVLAVPHKEILELSYLDRKGSSVLFDVKGALVGVEVDGVL